MSTKKTSEPFWWGLFSAGGVVAAFLVPIHIILVGFAVPLGWITDVGALYRVWWVKLYLFVLIVLPLYHWAHRFYFTLNDMGLKPINKLLAVLCYGGAIVGTIITAWILLQV
ncbi:MAG TPA: fumarate reductase subunit FrdD [Candidatus Binatia bacterium]